MALALPIVVALLALALYAQRLGFEARRQSLPLLLSTLALCLGGAVRDATIWASAKPLQWNLIGSALLTLGAALALLAILRMLPR